MMYPLVRDLAAEQIPVAVTCRVLGFSKQAYYQWCVDPVSQRDWDDAHLINAAIDIHHDDPEFGYRFIADELADRGITASRNRVNRLCTLQRIFSVHSKKRGSGRKPGPPVHDDLVVRQFTAARPNLLWLTDITEHPTAEGKLYLCAVKDACTNRIVGYSMAERMTSQLAVDAITNAIALRHPAGTVVHSDRGSQGGFNRSSQHLDRGGVQRWRLATGARRPVTCPKGCVGSGVLTERCGRRCARLDGLSRREQCSGSSGG
jgi:putative transposase